MKGVLRLRGDAHIKGVIRLRGLAAMMDVEELKPFNMSLRCHRRCCLGSDAEKMTMELMLRGEFLCFLLLASDMPLMLMSWCAPLLLCLSLLRVSQFTAGTILSCWRSILHNKHWRRNMLKGVCRPACRLNI